MKFCQAVDEIVIGELQVSCLQSEIVSILHYMVGDNVSEEQLNSIAHRSVYEVVHGDENAADRMITFEQFKRALENIDFEQKMSIRFLH